MPRIWADLGGRKSGRILPPTSGGKNLPPKLFNEINELSKNLGGRKSGRKKKSPAHNVLISFKNLGGRNLPPKGGLRFYPGSPTSGSNASDEKRKEKP
jgi:hypothetical protein